MPDFDSVEVEMVRRSKYKKKPDDGDPLSSQYSVLNFTVNQPDGNWLLGVNPGWAIYEDDKFLKSECTINPHQPGVDWDEVYDDLVWEGFTDWFPNRTYTIYPVYKSWFDSAPARVDAPVTVKYEGIVTTGTESYKWLNKDILECSFSCHSDVEPFVLNPYFYGRGIVISDRPLIIENGMLQYTYMDDVNSTFYFCDETREEGIDYARAYTTKVNFLEKGKNYYYCAAVKLGNRGEGLPLYYCGSVNKFYLPMYPDTPEGE